MNSFKQGDRVRILPPLNTRGGKENNGEIIGFYRRNNGKGRVEAKVKLDGMSIHGYWLCPLNAIRKIEVK